MLVIVIVISFGLGIAYLVLGHIHWHGLYIDHEIHPIEVLTLLVSISIAILLQYVFIERSSNLRAEKDLIIGDINSVITLLRENNEVFLRSASTESLDAGDWSLCKVQSRQISNAIEYLDISLGASSCNACKRLSGKSSTMANMKSNFFEYKAAVTGGAPNKPLAADMISSQASLYRSLMRMLRDLMSQINRH